MDELSPTSDASSGFIMINNSNTPIEGSPQPPTHPNNPSSTSTSSNMPCPHCNTVNPSFFDSCTKCGNSLSPTITTPNHENNDNENPPEPAHEPMPPLSPPMPTSESQYQPEPPQYIIQPQDIASAPFVTQPHQTQPPPYNPNFDDNNIAGNNITYTQGQPQNPNAKGYQFQHNTQKGTTASETPGSWEPYETNQREPELGHRYTQYNPNNATAYHLDAPSENLYPAEEQLFGKFFIRSISTACSLIIVTLLSFHLWFTKSSDEFKAAHALSAMGMRNLYLFT